MSLEKVGHVLAEATVTTVLLVEDSASDVALLSRGLKRAGLTVAITHVVSAIEMENALRTTQFDIVISDFSLPGFGALEALRILHKHDPDISFVVVSGAVGEEIAVEVMRAGASDFIMKSALSRLPFVMSRELGEAKQRRARREAEEDLRRSQAELEVALRNAKAANELKTAFLANMSHEIRTPIGAILGYAELASDIEVPPGTELPAYIEAIRRNGAHLLSLIGDLLDLTKIESDHLEIESLQLNLRDEIHAVLLAATPAMKAKQIRFNEDLSQLKFNQLVSDPTRIKQVLINVIGNAVKFTDGGEISLTVTQKLKETNGDGPLQGQRVLTRCLVKDSGIGMNDEQRSRLFEPFTQGDSSTTRKFGGTGLGLSLARKLAQHLGGDLRLLTTAPGVGSTFEVSFEAQLAFAEAVATVLTTRYKDPTLLAGFKILLVEDSPDNQMIVQRFLTPTGAYVEIASSGIEALEKTKHVNYDLVLMDMQLPGIDGTQALRRLRASGHVVPVVALTAHAFKGAREQALKEGFSDYLTKPIERGVLIEALIKHLKK